MPEQSTLELTLLGSFQAKRDVDLEITSSKQVALLTYLALNNLSLERAYLSDLLWPSSTQSAAAKSLRNILWQLRKVADGEIFSMDESALTLADTTKTDVRGFEKMAHHIMAHQDPTQAAEMLKLYRGSLLTGWLSADLVSFEQWLAVERRRLENLAVGAIEMLVRIYALGGDWSRTLEVATRALMVDPYSEASYRSLMLAHARRDELARVHELYAQLCTRLTTDLAIAPQAETVRLYQRIVASEQVTASDVWQPLAIRAQARRLHSAENIDLPLYERDSTPQPAMLIEGAFGMGKTRLLHAIAEQRDRPIIIRAAQLETPATLQPILDALHAIADQLEDLPQPQRDAIGRWLPQFQTDTTPTYAHPFEPIAQAFAHAAPLHLFFDDMHLADADSRAVLTYLAERFAELQTPVTLTVAQNPSTDNRLPVRQTLQSLSFNAIATASRYLGQTDVSVAQRWRDLSEGNPFWLTQVVRGTRELASLAAYVQAGMEAVSVEAGAWLFATAILGEDATFERVRKLLEMEEMNALKTLGDALESGWLSAENEDQRLHRRAYIFSHNDIRLEVLQRLDKKQKVHFHRRAYESCLTAGRPNETLAYHAQQAGLQRQAFDHLLLAIEDARAKLATQSAERLLSTARKMATMSDAIEWITAAQEATLRRLLNTVMQEQDNK